MNKFPVLDQVVLAYSPMVGRWSDWAGLRVRLAPSGPRVEPDAAGLLAALAEIWSGGPAAERTDAAAPSPVLLEAVDAQWAERLSRQPLPRSVGLVLPGELALAGTLLDRLRAGQADGIWLAVRAASWAEVPEAARGCFTDLLLDARAALAPGRRIERNGWVDGAQSLSEIDALLERGAKGIVGWPRVARPSAGRDVRAEVPVVVDLMNRVERQEPLDNLERALKTDPTLVYRLLRYVNSAALGLKVEVAALRQALLLLGYLPLLRWLSRMLLEAAAKEGASRPLVYLSVCRAFVMERIALASGQADEAPEMFLCGMLSLLHLLLQRPLEELTATLPIPERVRCSLLEPDADYSLHLRWVEAAESGLVTGVREALAALRLDLGVANLALLQGLAAARSLDV